ncbi:ketopantoate reductase family protein [Clostridium guangxiense]|uniref:ketopantoate reductase family protein n=1 Tax=Clostridium guangxiense TaxID=1662055 RepID=UPI001E476BFA|nr:ketopantoate reductase family protein [Clostridium guangxiense]MCD2345878.1 ketopantoate reductase family protein [Clostridium guangxiense]
MKQIENVALIGMGAVGCAFGRNFYNFNQDKFRVIAKGERKDRYEKNGFIINGKKYNFACVSPDENREPFDLVIVSVKGTELKNSLEDIKNFVGKDTIILSLLNGISSEEIIGERYGMDKLLYSFCIIEATRLGNEVHVSDRYRIVFGEKQNKVYSEKVQAVKEFFERAGVSYEIPENMLHAQWSKFMFNVGINTASAALKSDYGVFQTSKAARELMISLMMEVVEVSKKTGVNLNKTDIENWCKILDTCEPEGKTSMCQDILSGRKTEVDMFSKTVCDLGERYSIATPVNKTFLNMIKVMENHEK